MELKQIPSEIRYKVDALFRANGIVIAFPQKDVHFRTPLRVTLNTPPVSGKENPLNK